MNALYAFMGAVFYPRVNSTMDRTPKIRIESSFFRIFSLKRIAPQRIESRITPMLSVGKRIALSSIPASEVFKRLQHPKKRPTQQATASFCGGGEAAGFFTRRAKDRESVAASKKARNRKSDLSAA